MAITVKHLEQILLSVPVNNPAGLQTLKEMRQQTGELFPAMTQRQKTLLVTELKQRQQAAAVMEEKIKKLRPVVLQQSSDETETFCL